MSWRKRNWKQDGYQPRKWSNDNRQSSKRKRFDQRDNQPRKRPAPSEQPQKKPNKKDALVATVGFVKPGSLKISLLEDNAPIYNPHKYQPLNKQRMMLPIFKKRKQILYAIEKYRTTVIVGQTGSGKSTQIPQFLHEAGWTDGGRAVACTQPRRVAAHTLAERVAQEVGCELGSTVGYSVRFEYFHSDETKIKYLTDGMLLRELGKDPLLRGYSVIMVDEAHERTTATDLILGLLKKLIKLRTDLRLVISSATLDAELFKNFFELNDTDDPSKDTSIIVGVDGRMYPVDVFYSAKPCRHIVMEAMETVLKIHETQKKGDVLVFLTGEDDVEQCCELLRERRYGVKSKHVEKMEVYPLYSRMDKPRQLRCFQTTRANTRKVIVSTNIGETSVTIPGIVYVVDSMHFKQHSYDPVTGLEYLQRHPVSKASANQRKGRAGRVQNGICYRICKQDDYEKLIDNTVPEIQRIDLAPIILQMKGLGVRNVVHFPFISPPPSRLVAHALETLAALKLIDRKGELTTVGKMAALLPVDPRVAVMILHSCTEFKCGEEVLTIAAMLSVDRIFHRPRSRGGYTELEDIKSKFVVLEGDLFTRLNIFNTYVLNHCNPEWCDTHMIDYGAMKKATRIRKQLRGYMKLFQLPVESSQGESAPVMNSIVRGFFMNACQLQNNGEYRLIRGGARHMNVHSGSVLYGEGIPWVLFTVAMETNRQYMHYCTAINAKTLLEMAPHYFNFRTQVL